MVKASALRAGDPGFDSRLRCGDFFFGGGGGGRGGRVIPVTSKLLKITGQLVNIGNSDVRCLVSYNV